MSRNSNPQDEVPFPLLSGVDAAIEPAPARHAALCLRCGHAWLSRSKRPAQCAHCQSVLWNKARSYA